MKNHGIQPSELMKNREALTKLAHSGDVKQLMRMLQKESNMQDAAKAAAAGNPAELMGMLQKLMNTQEGTKLIENISQRAKESGLTEK